MLNSLFILFIVYQGRQVLNEVKLHFCIQLLHMLSPNLALMYLIYKCSYRQIDRKMVSKSFMW